MAKFNKFQRGSGISTFVCRCCKHRTRQVNQDHAQLQLCAPCFELAGIENAILDAEDRAVTIAQYREEIEEHFATIQSRGGSMESWRDLQAWLEEYSGAQVVVDVEAVVDIEAAHLTSLLAGMLGF